MNQLHWRQAASRAETRLRAARGRLAGCAGSTCCRAMQENLVLCRPTCPTIIWSRAGLSVYPSTAARECGGSGTAVIAMLRQVFPSIRALRCVNAAIRGRQLLQCRAGFSVYPSAAARECGGSGRMVIAMSVRTYFAANQMKRFRRVNGSHPTALRSGIEKARSPPRRIDGGKPRFYILYAHMPRVTPR